MKSQTILIVDDIAINRKLLQAQLEGEGYVIASASNGVEALKILEREKIDVIISDVLMPEMDGYRLCYEVRRSERLGETPFILHSATYTSPADEKLSLDLGADQYLRKPASLEDLKRAIAESAMSTHRRPSVSLAGMDVLKEYSERLVSKLKEKSIELTSAAGQLTLQTTALEMAADAILITDPNGTILWVNQAFVAITGFTREEAIGNTPRILKSGSHDAAFYGEFWDTIKSGRVWRGEFTNRHKDGHLYWDEHTISPVPNADGQVSHFVGVMQDITERKRIEEELKATHAQLRQLLEHSPAVIYALTVKGETLIPHIVSENITRLLGFSVAETLSYEWWFQSLHPEDRALATTSLAETLSEGVGRCEYRMQHKDGTYRWVEDNRRLVRNARGEPSELVGVWTDLSERRRAQDELRMSERRFSDMLGNLQLVAMMLDRDGRITYCNDYLLRISGWKREELLGREWLEVFIPPEQVAEMKGVFALLLADAPESWHHENDIVTRSGERRLIHWNNTALRSGSGDVVGTASIGEDITDRKMLEKQLFRAQRLESLGTLAGGIAHDLNNLFMPILMGVTLIKRFNPPEATLKAIENIERCVKRGTNLVKQVLLFARGGDGPKVGIAIASIVEEVEAIALSTFPKNVTLAISMDRNLPLILGDPTQLTQVILNLVVNSRDSMPGGGRITVSAETIEINERFAAIHGGSGGGSHVVLDIADNGSGIPQEVVDHIFEPFFTTKAVGLGTGLGLSTAQGIVRNHNGFITVSSEVGKGSTFKIYLPAQSERKDATVSHPEEQEAPRGNSELILVVDDEVAILEITRQTLQAFGYEVLTAEDGAQAIDVYARNRSIGLVLTDMMMPLIDGATLISALRRIDPDVRIIAASGLDGTIQRARSVNGGNFHFLAKPFTAELMLRTIFQVLHPTG